MKAKTILQEETSVKKPKVRGENKVKEDEQCRQLKQRN